MNCLALAVLNRDGRFGRSHLIHRHYKAVVRHRFSRVYNATIRPICHNSMELQFFREDTQNVTVRDPVNKVLYSIHAPKSHFSKTSLRIYRDEFDETSDHHELATISKSRHWHSDWVIKYEDQSIRMSHHHFTSKNRFIFGDREFEWIGDKELVDLKRGEVIASFKRCHFDFGMGNVCGVEKIGTMVISNAGLGIVDVVVLTGVAMQRRWEKSRSGSGVEGHKRGLRSMR
jgi:hypothetical protein